jgi:hypothetical protein
MPMTQRGAAGSGGGNQGGLPPKSAGSTPALEHFAIREGGDDD